MSRRPNRSAAASTIVATAVASRTSATKVSASPPASWASACVALAPSISTSAIITPAPASTSRNVIARPMPEPAPVTTAARPASDHSDARSGKPVGAVMIRPLVDVQSDYRFPSSTQFSWHSIRVYPYRTPTEAALGGDEGLEGDAEAAVDPDHLSAHVARPVTQQEHHHRCDIAGRTGAPQ